MADALATLSVGVAFLHDYVGGREAGQDSGQANFHHVVAACRTLNGGRLLGPDGRPRGGGAAEGSGTPAAVRPHEPRQPGGRWGGGWHGHPNSGGRILH